MTERPERWVVRKPAVESRGGVVATQHQAASAVGARVLADGGNAVDAAIAASVALATVEPWMSGLGGGGYMLVRPAGADRTWAISFGMVAPGGLDPADYPLTGAAGAEMFGWPAVRDDRNLRGPFAVAVPGQVAGLALACERFGSRRWADLLAPACALAERGMDVDWHATLAIAASAPELAADPGCAAAYLADGYPHASPWTGPLPRIRLGRLAETLHRLAEAGPEDFYRGEIARAICADMAALGGRLGAADLAGYRAHVEEAPTARYRDALVSTAPGLTAGPTLIDVLRRLAASFTPGEAPDGTAYAAYAQALRDAYAERLRGMGEGTGADRASCTSHLGAVDRDGTLVALTQTLLSPFGAKVMLPETGVLMNNGIMWFDPRPAGPIPSPRQAAALQHVPDHRRARGRAPRGARRVRRAAHPARRRAAALLPRGLRHEPGRCRALPAHQCRWRRPRRGGCAAAGRDACHAGGPVRARGASSRGSPVVLRLPQRGGVGCAGGHGKRRRPRDVAQRERRRALSGDARQQGRSPCGAERASA